MTMNLLLLEVTCEKNKTILVGNILEPSYCKKQQKKRHIEEDGQVFREEYEMNQDAPSLTPMTYKPTPVYIEIERQWTTALLLYQTEVECRECYDRYHVDLPTSSNAQRQRRTIESISEPTRMENIFPNLYAMDNVPRGDASSHSRPPLVSSSSTAAKKIDPGVYYGVTVSSTDPILLKSICDRFSAPSCRLVYPYLGSRETFILKNNLVFPCIVTLTEKSLVWGTDPRHKNRATCDRMKSLQRRTDLESLIVPSSTLSSSSSPLPPKIKCFLLGCELDLFTCFNTRTNEHQIRTIVCRFFPFGGLDGMIHESSSSSVHEGDSDVQESLWTLQDDSCDYPCGSDGGGFVDVYKSALHKRWMSKSVYFSVNDGHLLPVFAKPTPSVSDLSSDHSLVDQSIHLPPSSSPPKSPSRGFPDERSLLKDFAKWFSDVDPDLVTSFRLDSVVIPQLKRAYGRYKDHELGGFSFRSLCRRGSERFSSHRMVVDLQTYIRKSVKTIQMSNSIKEVASHYFPDGNVPLHHKECNDESSILPQEPMCLDSPPPPPQDGNHAGDDVFIGIDPWENPRDNYKYLCTPTETNLVRRSLEWIFNICFSILKQTQLIALNVSLARGCYSPLEHTFHDAPILRNQWCLTREFHDLGTLIIPSPPNLSTLRDVDQRDIFGYSSTNKYHHGGSLPFRQHPQQQIGKRTRDPNVEENGPSDQDTATNSSTSAAYQGGLKQAREYALGWNGASVSAPIVEFDLNSIYPNAFIQYDIGFSPEDHSSVLSTFMSRAITMRKKHTELSQTVGDAHYIASQACKLRANAMYGCIGATCFRFSSIYAASEVCRVIREFLKDSIACIESMGYCVLYYDTDSIFWTCLWLYVNRMNHDSKSPSDDPRRRIDSPSSSSKQKAIHHHHHHQNELKRELSQNDIEHVLEVLNSLCQPHFAFKIQDIYQGMYISSVSNAVMVPMSVPSLTSLKNLDSCTMKGLLKNRVIAPVIRRVCSEFISLIIAHRSSSSAPSISPSSSVMDGDGMDDEDESLLDAVYKFLRREKRQFKHHDVSEFRSLMECKCSILEATERCFSSMRVFSKSPQHVVALDMFVNENHYPSCEGDVIPLIMCLDRCMRHPQQIRNFPSEFRIDFHYYWCIRMKTTILNLCRGNLSFIGTYLRSLDLFHEFQM